MTKKKDIVGQLLALADDVKQAAIDEDSDLVRTHLNNIHGCIVGLSEAQRQIKSWERPEVPA